ncbi:MAG: DUF4197 domain-containing protein [Acidobacteria bacterium]|jgi:hypothetical protein|nr:DUF4197 domain-containing protein [Acidobacteriota bacterium]
MKPGILAALVLAILPMGCESAGVYAPVLGSVITQPGGPLTSAEIEAGLREALTVGTTNVAAQLGKSNGYYGDPKIRIPLPGTYREVQRNLAVIGASGPLDDVELRLNRAAEAAVPEARALILGAVRSMTIEDALGILRGGDTAATDFLRNRTETQLKAAFTPHVKAALSKSGAFTSMESYLSGIGLGGATSTMQAELTSHAVSLGLDGIFLYVAEEEKKIRENPVARTTDLLRKVFGAAA